MILVAFLFSSFIYRFFHSRACAPERFSAQARKRESRLCPCEGREPETYETGFLFAQENLVSCWSLPHTLLRGRRKNKRKQVYTLCPMRYALCVIFRRYFLSISMAIMDARSRTIQSSPPREYSCFSIPFSVERA